MKQPSQTQMRAWYGNPHTPGYAQGHIITIKPLPGPTKLQVNRLLAPVFGGFLVELDTKYDVDDFQLNDWGFYVRPVTGGTYDSWHAYGAAVDINAPRNPRHKPVITEMPISYVRMLCTKWHLTWGIDFPTPDPMHFQANEAPEVYAQLVANLANLANPDPRVLTGARPVTQQDVLIHDSVGRQQAFLFHIYQDVKRVNPKASIQLRPNAEKKPGDVVGETEAAVASMEPTMHELMLYQHGLADFLSGKSTPLS